MTLGGECTRVVVEARAGAEGGRLDGVCHCSSGKTSSAFRQSGGDKLRKDGIGVCF